MMKKFLILFVCLCPMLFVTKAQNNFYLFESTLNAGTAMNPAGTKVVGIEQGLDLISYIWEIEGGEITWISKGLTPDDTFGARDVTDNNVIIGQYRNLDVMAELENAVGEPEEMPVLMAGVWESGNITPLGLGELEPEDLVSIVDGSVPTRISADGKTITGYLAVSMVYTPYIWVYNETEDKWEHKKMLPDGYTEGQILDISNDGKLAVGYLQDENYMKKPVLWDIENDTWKILADEVEYLSGTAFRISANGKYIAFTYGYGSRALYDVENSTYITVDDFDDFYADDWTVAGVTDDGIIFGTFISGNPFHGSLQGRSFFFSEEMGTVDFEYYVLNLTGGIIRPDGVFFAYQDGMYYELVDIMSDGKTIMGVIAHKHLGEQKTFIIKATKDIEYTAVNRPRNLVAEISNRNVVELTWEAPEVEQGQTVTAYNVYRDGQILFTIEDNQTLTYTDQNAPGGYIKYGISAVYGEIESLRTENYTAIIIDSYELPFFDGFESGDMEAGFWRQEYTQLPMFAGEPFGVQDYFYFLGFYGLKCSYNGNGEPFAYQLISKPLDPSDSEEVYISVAIRLMTSTPVNEKADTLEIQVSKGEDWITVLKINTHNAPTAWATYYMDVKDIVGDDMFQVRFLATGKSTNEILWNIDNFRVDNVKNEAPEDVLVFGQNNTNKIVWKNTMDAYEATYLDYRETLGRMAIGNEGKPFIALNAFDGKDLNPFKDMYLTSITLPVDVYHPEDLKFAIQVYIDNVLTENQEIQSFTNNVLNTFPLNTPVLIDGKKNIKFGIRVIEHNTEDLIVAYQVTTNPTPFKSDLLSEDDGKTWISVSETYGNDPQFEIPENFIINWEITGNITETDKAEKTEPDGTLFAYNVYKDGVRINDLMIFYYPVFIDENYDEDACYEVRAYYYNGKFSELSEEGCFDENLGGNTGLNPGKEADAIRIYPNPANSVINIEGELNRAVLYDLNGKAVMETLTNQMNVRNVADGIYLMRIESNEGNSHQKVIIRK